MIAEECRVIGRDPRRELGGIGLRRDRHVPDRSPRGLRNLRRRLGEREEARARQLVGLPGVRRGSVSAATATSAMSSTSRNGSATSPAGKAISPPRTGPSSVPSLKFCANHAARRMVKIAPALGPEADEWPADELFLVTHRALRDVPRVRVVWDLLVTRLGPSGSARNESPRAR